MESYCARSRIASLFFADLTRVNNTGNERTNTWRNTTAVNFPTRRRHTTADYRTITLTPPATFLPTHAFSLRLDSLVHTTSSVHTTYSGIEAVQRLHPLTLALLVATGSRLRWLYCVPVLCRVLCRGCQWSIWLEARTSSDRRLERCLRGAGGPVRLAHGGRSWSGSNPTPLRTLSLERFLRGVKW